MDQSSLEVGKAVESIVDALREQTTASTDIAQRVEMIAQGIEQDTCGFRRIEPPFGRAG